MTIYSLATKIFLREFRSGQLLLMFLSLSLAVGIVASITFFTDRLDGSLMMESKQFLGGDLKYESDTPLDESSFPIGDYSYASIYEFGSVLGSSKNFQLASVKSVSPPYPLIGEFEIQKKYDERVLETNPPKPGKVWLDTRLANLLEVTINDTVNIGEKDFSISGIILSESDRGAGSFAFAPKAIMNSSDLEEANVIQPGSRVRYSYVFVGSEETIKLLENFFQSKKNQEMKLLLQETKQVH